MDDDSDVEVLTELEQGASGIERLWSAFWQNQTSDIKAQLYHYYQAHAHRIAKSVYFSRAWTSLELDDCIQYGAEGLLSAIDRFERAKGASFETYSSYRIRGSILNGIDKYSEEFDFAAYQRRIRQEKVASIAAENSAESGDSFSRIVDVTVELALGYLLQGAQQLTELVDESPYVNPSRITLQRQLLNLVQDLPEKQRQVLTQYYFEDIPFVEIAEQLGVTKARVSQIHGEALKKLHLQCQSRSIIK